MDMDETKTTIASKEELASSENLAKANEIVRNRVYWSVGAGLVPIPIVDMAALLAIQLEMVAKLAKLYDQPFRKDIAKSTVVALLGSIIPTLAAGPMASLLKAIPIIGYTTGAVSMCIVGGAGTYAVGKVFTKHFESGGTLFDFDPAKKKEEFAKSFEEGKTAVNEMKNNV
jgi:uncharacterized protein (DUF697 family)